jgi:hypothetical protein
LWSYWWRITMQRSRILWHQAIRQILVVQWLWNFKVL